MIKRRRNPERGESEDTMKKYDELWEMFSGYSIERKCSFMVRHSGIPCIVSTGSWSGMEIRLTEGSDSAVFDPTHIKLNVSDRELFEQILETFNDVDNHIVEVISKVIMTYSLKGGFGLMLPLEGDEVNKIFRRWKRFLDWVDTHYDLSKTLWWHDDSLPENMLAWAARSILGGIMPSRVGINAIKNKIADIDEYGLLTYKKVKGSDKCVCYSVYDFSADSDAKYDCFGYSGVLSIEISRCFGKVKDPNKYSVSKIPEQWEIERGFYCCTAK